MFARGRPETTAEEDGWASYLRGGQLKNRLHDTEEMDPVVAKRRPVTDDQQAALQARLTDGRPSAAGMAAMQPAQMLALQRLVGNETVVRMMQVTPSPMVIRRMKEPLVTNPKLQNIVNDLYKGAHMKRGKVIGDGSTADAIREEHRSGKDTKGVNHDEKGEQYISALENWLNKGGPNGGKNASQEDRQAAQDLIDDLDDALDS